ncbi:PAS domain-containing sensor histidine kinase [Azospirillum sp. SYSU D00513]|uniref:sensor histidine kinase n=1 Tax=Azospirillum sp. SYSU D00513 TaxID=2812561 RepID=UPI001A976ECB|nr:PAS domain-containing sensor histidine kinase [Azospirillum sp. SYSU D00513]
MTAREAQLDALLSASVAPQALFAPDGRLLVVNRAFAVAFGHLPDEIEGLRLEEAGATPAVAAHVEAQIRRAAATGGTATIEGVPAGMALTLTPVRDADGLVHSMAAIAVPAAGTDASSSREALLRELEAARAEAERAREEAVRARKAAGKFLSTANHDLRQPFQAMQLFHHLLMMKLTDPAARDLGEKLEMAIMGSDALLRTLVEVSRLEAGLVEAATENFAVEDSLRRMREEFAPEAKAKLLRLSIRKADAQVHSDPVLLERLLRPLISNALRYTDRGGVVVGVRRRGVGLRVEVWDSGIGIPESDVEAAFEDFRQLDNPNRDRKQGLGLGLSIVRRLADLLGHQVTLRSRPGRGTVVVVDLPPARDERQDAVQRAEPSLASL